MTELASPAPPCPHCRAQQRSGRLTVRYLAHRAREELVGRERGLLATFWHLLLQPRRVVDAFLAADPPRYYSPIKYFLVATAVSLLFTPNAPMFDGFVAHMLSKQGLATAENARQWVEDWNSLLYIPLMLFLALAMRLFFRARELNLAEHLVIATYGWSQMLLIGTLSFLFASALKQVGIKGVWLLPLLFMSTAYWIWFCGQVLRIRSLADWTRCLAAVPGALFMFMVTLLGIAGTIKILLAMAAATSL
jgi:hypothetical protein